MPRLIIPGLIIGGELWKQDREKKARREAEKKQQAAIAQQQRLETLTGEHWEGLKNLNATANNSRIDYRRRTLEAG